MLPAIIPPRPNPRTIIRVIIIVKVIDHVIITAKITYVFLRVSSIRCTVRKLSNYKDST